MGQHPAESNRSGPICFSPYLYRGRNQIERFFNRIKQCRRIATRYERLAANYLAFVQLASIRLWLRFKKSVAWIETGLHVGERAKRLRHVPAFMALNVTPTARQVFACERGSGLSPRALAGALIASA